MIRYQVFVSSTYKDLKKERGIIKKALLEKKCFPAGMEEFPATDEEQFEYIKRIIDDSDYYILILGGYIGTICKETKETYTYMEYQYAKEKGIPIIVFIKKDKLGQLICAEEGKKRRLYYEKFVEEVCANRMCSFFTKKEQLSGMTHFSLDEEIKKNPRLGWKKVENIAINNNSDLIIRGKILEYFIIGYEIYDIIDKFVHLPSYGQTDKKIILKYGQDTQGTFKLVAFVGEDTHNFFYDVENVYFDGNGYLKPDIKMQITLARLGNNEEVLLFFSMGNLSSELTTKIYKFGNMGLKEIAQIDGQEYMWIDYDLKVPYGSQGLFESYVYLRNNMYLTTNLENQKTLKGVE